MKKGEGEGEGGERVAAFEKGAADRESRYIYI